MKTSEIANRVLEATQLAVIADLLKGEFDLVDTSILESLANQLDDLVDELVAPVQDKIKEEV